VVIDECGTRTLGGGSLTGIQSWRGLDGAGHSRTCQVALLLAANDNSANANQGAMQ
jgi:deoxyxylulose-5-phosphate synthase